MKYNGIKELKNKVLDILREDKSWNGIGTDIPEKLENMDFIEVFSNTGHKEYKHLKSNIYFIVSYSNKLYIRYKNYISFKGYIIF